MDEGERELRRLLGANVARFRKALGYSLEDAAGRGPLDPRHWQRVEAGEVSATLRTIARLSRALDVRVALLFAQQ